MAKNLFECFVDLEKAYDRVPLDKLWKVLQEYGIDGQLLLANKYFYCQPEVVFVLTVSNQNHSMWALVSGKGAFCLLSFS